MTYSLTFAELEALAPCNFDKYRQLFAGVERLTAREALAQGASIKDLLWVAEKLELKRECVEFALACARRVAHLNSHHRVGAALDAAQAWLDNPSDASASAANSAANAANAAGNACVAYVTGAAANARAAANTRAAAYAAYAASAAARAAYAGYAVYVGCAASASAYAGYAAATLAESGAESERADQERIFLEIFDPQGQGGAVSIDNKEGAGQ